MDAKLVERITALELENERLLVERNDQQQKIDRLENRVYQLLHALYGRRSERYEHPHQGDLLDLLSEDDSGSLTGKPEVDPSTDREEITYQRRRTKKHGPKPLPENLERIVERVDPPEHERVCACCSEAMECVDEVVTEELDIVPPKLRVKRYVQGKWRCRECMNRDVVKPLPPRPIPKGRPSPSLLAYIIIAKYCDHLPLYRQEKILARHGIEITRSTMDSWLGQISPLLLPIVEAMKRELLKRGFLQIDETPIQALDPELKGKSRRCYVWCFGHPRGEVVYFVSESRSGKWPKAELAGFTGHLQSDGFKGYDRIYREGEVFHIGCMSHIRRKFSDGLKSHPARVGAILKHIQRLFDLEALAKEQNLTYEERAELRQAEARPVFDELKVKIDELAPIPTPSSDLGKAVGYALGQWEAMERYLSVGEAELSNNLTEQDIKSVVIGRKNYLFLGRPGAGGERVKAFYSLIVSAKRLGIEPFEYLRDILEILPAIGADRAAELTPSRYLAARQAAENAPV